MTMILTKEQPFEAARQDLLDKPLEDYIGMLARTRPFSLEIAAEADQLFDALASNWPQMEGWEEQAAELSRQIHELADPFVIPGAECHLRLSLSVAVGPRTAPPVLTAPAVRAAYDIGESAFYHQVLQMGHSGDIAFDHISLGLVLLIQPFKGQGEARAIGIGIG